MQRGRERCDREGKCAFPSCQSVWLAASLRRRAPGGRTIPSPRRWYICAHPVNGVKKSVAGGRLLRKIQSMQAGRFLETAKNSCIGCKSEKHDRYVQFRKCFCLAFCVCGYGDNITDLFLDLLGCPQLQAGLECQWNAAGIGFSPCH